MQQKQAQRGGNRATLERTSSGSLG
eukprot:COSAG02_NODE_30042_length_558_cov_1.056645_1_plen_24_part_10